MRAIRNGAALFLAVYAFAREAGEIDCTAAPVVPGMSGSGGAGASACCNRQNRASDGLDSADAVREARGDAREYGPNWSKGT